MNNNIKKLLQKQLNGTITEEERHELTVMMESLSEEETVESYIMLFGMVSRLILNYLIFRPNVILSKIKHHSFRICIFA